MVNDWVSRVVYRDMGKEAWSETSFTDHKMVKIYLKKKRISGQ